MAKDTVLGIDQNLEALLCYVGGWITGIIFLAVEKENKFVRFHAMQSLATFLGLFILSFVAGLIPIVGWVIAILIIPVGLVLWLLLMYKAYNGEMYKLPVVGDFAVEQIFPETASSEGGEADVVDIEPDGSDEQKGTDRKR